MSGTYVRHSEESTAVFHAVPKYMVSFGLMLLYHEFTSTPHSRTLSKIQDSKNQANAVAQMYVQGFLQV